MTRLLSGTVGLRFTILYGAVFLVSGIGLLALAFLLSGGTFSDVEAVPGQQPSADGSAAQEQLRALQRQLAESDARHSRDMLIGSLVALLVMVAVSLLVGRLLARRVLRPLRTITARTRRISADNLDERLAVDGPADEVKDLADTVDDLLERLEASFSAQRRFVADASHELRTPMATMRASLDVAAAKPDAGRQTLALAERMRPQMDQMDRLLDGLLVLARAQHGALGASDDIDLADLVARAVNDRATEIRTRRLTLTEDLPQGMRIRGDAALLSRMVENVIDNAVVHNDEGGWIRAETVRVDDEVRLTVETGGRVLDQREVDRLVHPFRQLGGDRTGSAGGAGLGLSIVAAIADAHSGRISLTALPEGGLRVRITVPFAPIPTEAAV